MAEPTPMTTAEIVRVIDCIRSDANGMFLSVDVIDMPYELMVVILRATFGLRRQYRAWFDFRDRSIAEMERRGELRSSHFSGLRDVSNTDYS